MHHPLLSAHSALTSLAGSQQALELDLSSAWARIVERLWDFVGLAPGLLVGLVILGIAAVAARWVNGWRGPYKKLTTNAFLQDFARQAVAIAVFVIGALIALDVMQATSVVAALLGTAGVAGLAIGFAFKDLIENYIAGVLLSLRQPFAPDDFVMIDGEKGRVVRLTMRATILMTLDGNHLRLPNARVFKATILNYTKNPRRRFDIGVGVGVDADLLEAQELGLETLASLEGVLDDPAPSAAVEELGESNVLVSFYGWVDQREHSFVQVKSEAIRMVKTVLEEAEIDLPEPIYRVKMLETQAATSSERRPASSGRSSQSLRVNDELRAAMDEELRTGETSLLDSDAAKE